MLFFLDADTGQRLQSTDYPVAATDVPSGKLQSTQPIKIQWSRNRVPCAAPNSAIKCGLKRPLHFADTTFDVFTDAFAAPADPTLPDAFYTGTLTIDSEALRDLFPVATDGTSPASVPLIGEVLSGATPSATFDFLAYNNIIKGTESPAVAIPGPSGYPSASTVSTAVTKANAAEPGLGNPNADGGLLSSLANGVRSWLATSTLGRTLLNIANAAAGRTALGLGTMATQDAHAVNIGGGIIGGLSELAVGGNITASGSLEVGGNIYAPGSLSVDDGITSSGPFISDGQAVFHSEVVFGADEASSIDAEGNAAFTGTLTVGGQVQASAGSLKLGASGYNPTISSADDDGLVGGNLYLRAPYGAIHAQQPIHAPSIVVSEPLALPQFTAATLPDVSLYAGRMIWVSDTGQAAISDGNDWNGITLGGIIS